MSQILLSGPMAGEPIQIRYDGMDADNHEIEMSALADSLKGISRIIAVAANFAATQKYVQHSDAMAIRVIARPPEAHCFELVAWIKWATDNPLISTTVGGLAVSLVGYIFKRAANQRAEMKQLSAALEIAIKELGVKDQATADRLLSTIEKMADALIPSAKLAVSPIGRTASTLSLGTGSSPRAVVLGEAERDAIMEAGATEVGPESTFRVLITELDMESGACKISLSDAPETRVSGKITDPLFSAPDNPYALAMAGKREIDVRAKPTFRDGQMEKLHVSDVLI